MSHNKEVDKRYECFTPPEIFQPLGSFDLDPCTSIIRPWDIAKVNFTPDDDGLNKMQWFGRVWLNPPYGRALQDWIKKMNEYRNGICLIPSRTGTPWFHRQVFEQADAVYYLEDRIWYRDNHGNYICDKRTGKPGNCGHDSVLVTYGKYNIESVVDSGLKGYMQLLQSTSVVVVTSSGIWRTVITRAINVSGGEANVQDIYEIIEVVAKDKTEKNENWKAKVRQQLQYHFTRIAKGRYTNKKSSEE